MDDDKDSSETELVVFQTTSSKEALDLAVTYSELGLDAMLEQAGKDTLAELPLFATFVGLLRVGASIRDRMFVKKVAMYLCSANVSEAERAKFLLKHGDLKGQRKVGSALCLLIDAYDDADKATLLGAAHREALLDNIEVEDVLDIGRGLNIIFMKDMKEYWAAAIDEDDPHTALGRVSGSAKFRLCNAGFVLPPSAGGGWGGGGSMWKQSKLTQLGETVFQIYQQHFEAPKTITRMVGHIEPVD